MSKLLVALVAASFATVVGAQAGATKQEKQKTVSETTKAAVAAENPVGSPKVDKSAPKTGPATKQDKQAAVSNTTKAAVAAENPVGSPKVDKSTPRQPRPDLKDPANQKALQKAATQ
jgi:hypothetical protein